MKDVFLVVSDLHLSGSKKENRVSYDNEIIFVFKKITSLVEKYKAEDCKVNVIFLGDIFDRSYKTPHKYGTDSSFFILLDSLCENLYSVVGNHELTFYVNNPFWTLVNEVDSPKLMDTKYNVQPLGYASTIKIRDRLQIGNTMFHFNHYGCTDNSAEPGFVNIGLYHKSIYNKVLLEDARSKGLEVEYAEKVSHQDIPTLLKYDYAFLGHMHWFYGTWLEDGTYIYGLGSLGRPAISEVSNSFLERNIPAIVIEDDKFRSVDDNFFTLPTFEDAVIEDVVDKQHKKYEVTKMIREAKTYQSYEDDPISNIRSFLISQPRTLMVFNELVDNSFSTAEMIDQLKEIEDVLYK